jgi:hypothetical protein
MAAALALGCMQAQQPAAPTMVPHKALSAGAPTPFPPTNPIITLPGNFEWGQVGPKPSYTATNSPAGRQRGSRGR